MITTIIIMIIIIVIFSGTYTNSENRISVVKGDERK